MKIAVIDIETTGLDFEKDAILEIGIVELDLTTGKLLPLFDKIVNEPHYDATRNYTSWIFYNSSLTRDEVNNAMSLEFYRSAIQDILNEYPITAFNKQFDLGFLKAREFKVPKELDCPMILAKDILLIPHPKYGYKFPSVEEAWKYYFENVNYKESHRAFDDAIHEALIVREMYKNKEFKVKLNEN